MVSIVPSVFFTPLRFLALGGKQHEAGSLTDSRGSSLSQAINLRSDLRKMSPPGPQFPICKMVLPTYKNIFHLSLLATFCVISTDLSFYSQILSSAMLIHLTCTLSCFLFLFYFFLSWGFLLALPTKMALKLDRSGNQNGVS